MKITEILLITTIILLGLTLIILILILFVRKNFLPINSGKVIFEINRKKRTFRYMNHKSIENNKIPHTNNINGLYSGRWNLSDKFLKIFSDSTLKRYRAAVRTMDTTNQKEVEFSGKLRKSLIKRSKKDCFNIKILLNKADDGFIHATIIYKRITSTTKEFSLPTFNSKAFQNYKTKQVVLMIFNTKDRTKTKWKQVISIINKNLIYKPNPFLYKGRIIFAFPTNTPEKTLNSISKNSLKIIRGIKNTGIGFLCSAGGVMSSEAPDTPKKINETIIKLEYLINKSSYSKKLEKIETKDWSAFKLFRESYITYEQAIRTGDLEYKKAIVKKYKTNKPLVHFLYPEITDMNEKMFRKINSINYLRYGLIEKHISHILKEGVSKPSIVDVTTFWFLNNYHKINNKNIVYLIDVRNLESKTHMMAAIAQTQEKGFLCGIRLSEIKQDEINLIEKIRPKFVVIGRPLSTYIQDPENLLKLINLKSIINGKGIKVIFEEPSLKIDSKLVEKVGLDFFFNFK